MARVSSRRSATLARMPDWKLIAAGRKLDIPEEELATMAPVLDALHATLKSLRASNPLFAEPIVTFVCEPEEQP